MSYTLENLEEDTTYRIKIQSIDIAGNISEGIEKEFSTSRNVIVARIIGRNNSLYESEDDYEKNGILTKTLPRIFFKGNSILVTFLQFIDMRIIMLFKYIDKLKNFKNITEIY